MTGPILLVAAVALAAVAAVAWPLVRADGNPVDVDAGDPRRAELQDEIDRSLRAIKEIDFDHKAGNLSDADFAELDRAERARAAELLRRRDAGKG